MEFNKCSRCGAFYTTESSVCPNCEPKDMCEQITLKNYLNENAMPDSLEILSANTGISVKNLNRFLNNGEVNVSL